MSDWTITEYRDHLGKKLASAIDPSTWTNTILDQSLRDALVEFSEHGPITETSFRVTTAGPEQDLSALTDLFEPLQIAWPWSNNAISFRDWLRPFRRTGDFKIFFESPVWPVVGDILRIRYRKWHSIEGLDTYPLSTVPNYYDPAVLALAAYYACLTRIRQLTENPARATVQNSNTATETINTTVTVNNDLTDVVHPADVTSTSTTDVVHPADVTNTERRTDKTDNVSETERNFPWTSTANKTDSTTATETATRSGTITTDHNETATRSGTITTTHAGQVETQTTGANTKSADNTQQVLLHTDTITKLQELAAIYRKEADERLSHVQTQGGTIAWPKVGL